MLQERAAILAHILCTPYSHTSLYSVTSFEATCIVCIYMCLAVTCHQHFWQNESMTGSFMCCCDNMGVEQIPK